MSLKRNAHTLCQGPSDEQGLLSSTSQVRKSSAGFVAEKLDAIAEARQRESKKVQSASPGQQSSVLRPGQVKMQSTLSEYDCRLEELKKKLKVFLTERESRLVSARECDGLLGEMMSWVGGADLEGLRVRDPSSVAIQNQQQKCQVLQYLHVYICILVVFVLYMYGVISTYMYTCTLYIQCTYSIALLCYFTLSVRIYIHIYNVHTVCV